MVMKMNKIEFFNKYKSETNFIRSDAEANQLCGEKRKDLHKLIPSDKLYKYASLSDPHTLENIENGIIYFSDPANFNDPFDSVLGVSIDELLSDFMFKYTKDHLLAEPNTINKTLMLEVLDAFETEKINPDTVQKLFGVSISDINEENIETYKEQVMKIFFGFLSEVGVEINRENKKRIVNELRKKNFNKILSENKNEFIYDSFLSICRVLGIASEVNHYETKKKEIETNILKSNKKAASSSIRTTCLSTDYKNILMWSHYANKHNGICIEYDLKSAEGNFILHTLPIIYDDHRVIFDKKCITGITSDYKVNFNFEVLTEAIYQSMCYKSKAWKYENEWRVILAKSMTDENKYKAPKITKIYFGVNVDDETFNDSEKRIKLYDPSIECIRLRINGNKFEITE